MLAIICAACFWRGTIEGRAKIHRLIVFVPRCTYVRVCACVRERCKCMCMCERERESVCVRVSVTQHATIHCSTNTCVQSLPNPLFGPSLVPPPSHRPSLPLRNPNLRARTQSATNCNKLQHFATRCNTLQHTATDCNTPQLTATHCNTRQQTATHCNTL